MIAVSEISKTIDDFPGYHVTNHGRFFNSRTGRLMKLSPTNNGDLTVGLMRNKHQFRFSAKGIVARAFVEGENEIFNCPMLLDCDKENLHVDNIVWRPRWFAWCYTHQFNDIENWYFYGPIVDKATRTEYVNYIEAAVIHGLLCKDIMYSVYSEDKLVFPTRQKFAYVV